MDTFVNPSKGITLEKWFAFDFPIPENGPTKEPEYKTKLAAGGFCHLNVDLTHSSEKPAHESVYDKYGNPLRNQGFPCIYETSPQAGHGDPTEHDQIIDITTEACIDHTGRLSGSFVKWLEGNKEYQSRTRFHIHPLTFGSGAPTLLYQTNWVPLVATPEEENVWYWEDPSTEQELIFTAHTVIKPSFWKDNPDIAHEGVFKLVVSWEFWNRKDPEKPIRMPISGFDESMSFQLIENPVM